MLLECFNDKDKTNQIFGLPYVKNMKEAQKLISDETKNKDNHVFSIFIEDKIVGLIMFDNPSKNKKIYEIGYAIGKKYWGKGIATEAIKLMVDFGFNKLKLKRIWAGVDSENPASAKVLEKAGFEKEGVRKNHINYGKGNKYSNEILYAILN